MQWFDDFTKALATGRMPRSTALRGLGGLAGSATVAGLLPRAVFGAPRSPRAGAQHSAASAASRSLPAINGVVRPHPAAAAPQFGSGPCAFRSGADGIEFSYATSLATNGETLHFSLQHAAVVRRATRSAPLLVGGNTVVEIARGAESLIRMELQRDAVAPQQPAAVTASYRYGPSIRGIGQAALRASGDAVTGTIDGRPIAAVAATKNLARSNVRFADGQPLAEASLEPRLRAALDALSAHVRSDLATCKPGRRPPLRKPTAAEPHGRRELAREVAGASVLADAPDASDGTQQNVVPFQWNTPSCHDCVQDVDVGYAICLGSAETTSFICPPCALIVALECLKAQAEAFAGCWAPLVGGCCQDLCTSLGCCDSGYTCCAGYCCSGADVCAQGGICCPPAAPVGCGGSGNRPFCCSPDSVCCDDVCCPPGSTCCGDSCCPNGSACADPKAGVCCAPSGPGGGYFACGGCCSDQYVCHDGQCCVTVCGDQCCTDTAMSCNAQTGQCGYGQPCGAAFCGFGSHCVNGVCVATPTATATPGTRCPSLHPLRESEILYVCASQNPDGSTTKICCAPGLTCCGGKCCPSSDNCCRNGVCANCTVIPK